MIMELIDEDESVLIAGSPLHQSLVSSGVPVTGMEILQKDGLGMRKESSSLTAEKIAKQEDKKEESFLRKIWLKIQAAVRFLLHVLLPSSSDCVEKEMNRLIMCDLLNSKVLDDDDREFLENYLEDLPCASEFDAEQVTSWLSHLLHFSKRKKLCYRREVILNHARSELSFLSWMKKCLRLVQETELVARGFTLVSQKSPISLIEQGHISGVTIRQCPELRKLLFCTAREAVLTCRERTKYIIKNFPLNSDLDAEGRYLAFQPLESYGPCLQESANKELELYDLTDGFSVAALKGMVHLCHLHQSEFITRLILIFDFSSQGKKERPISGQLQKEILKFSDELQEWCQILERSFNFQNSNLLKSWEPEVKVKPSGQRSLYEDIGVAVHSLDLHLQAALTRVRSLSTWLEKLEDKNQSVDTDFLSHDTLTQMMQPIKAELESCKSCWEEGLNRIDRLARRNPDSNHEVSVVKERSDGVPLSNSAKTKVVPVEDTIIVDQVFEAYTDDDPAEHMSSGLEQPLTAEDKAKRKREKEEALRLLKELKSVILVRSEEMQRREADALQRFRDLTCTAGVSKEEECSLTKEKECTESTESPKDEQLGGTADLPEDFHHKESAKHIGSTLVNCDKHLLSSKNNWAENSNNVDEACNMSENKNSRYSQDNNTIKQSCHIAKADLAENYGIPHTVSDDFVGSGSVVPLCNTELNELKNSSSLENKTGNHEAKASLKVECGSVNTVASDYSSEEADNSDMKNIAISDAGVADDSESDQVLNISGWLPQERPIVSNVGDVHDKLDIEEGTNSDKTSSYLNISSDRESAYSAISYDNHDMEDEDWSPMKSTLNGSNNEDMEVLAISDKSYDISDNLSSENLETESSLVEIDSPMTLEERLELIHGANLSFTSNVAALAAAKSRAFGLVHESTYQGETFGDDSDQNSDSDDDRYEI